jgi:phage terminase large subunit GpA-like protein
MTVRSKRGYAKLEWQQMRDRNEALDCRVYARAAAWLMGIDRWDERKWGGLAAQLEKGRKETLPAGQPSRPAPATTPATPRKPGILGQRKKGWF